MCATPDAPCLPAGRPAAFANLLFSPSEPQCHATDLLTGQVICVTFGSVAGAAGSHAEGGGGSMRVLSSSSPLLSPRHCADVLALIECHAADAEAAAGAAGRCVAQRDSLAGGGKPTPTTKPPAPVPSDRPAPSGAASFDAACARWLSPASCGVTAVVLPAACCAFAARSARPCHAPASFAWSDAPEPHAARRKAIMAAHPGVRDLFGPCARTKYVVLLVVVAQLAAAKAAAALPWPALALLAWALGGALTSNLFLAGA